MWLSRYLRGQDQPIGLFPGGQGRRDRRGSRGDQEWAVRLDPVLAENQPGAGGQMGPPDEFGLEQDHRPAATFGPGSRSGEPLTGLLAVEMYWAVQLEGAAVGLIAARGGMDPGDAAFEGMPDVHGYEAQAFEAAAILEKRIGDQHGGRAAGTLGLLIPDPDHHRAFGPWGLGFRDFTATSADEKQAQ